MMSATTPAAITGQTAGGADAMPLVSCIMPTHNRRGFVPTAIRAFMQQDFPERELIVVDDGTDPVEDLIPADPRIRYLRRPPKMSVGAKRNLACEQANGSLIAHWDDDDWHAPWRLSYQVGSLLAQQADLCGLDTLWLFDPLKNQGWQFRYTAPGRRWLAGGSFCYRRTLWERHRFANIFDGEDTQFVTGVTRARVMRLDRTDFYLARIHGGNTNAKRPGTTYWHAVPVDTIRAMLGADFAPFVACEADPTKPGITQQGQPAADRPGQGHSAADQGDRQPHPLRRGADHDPRRLQTGEPTPRHLDRRGTIAIGVHVHAEPHILQATLAALDAHGGAGCELLLLPDAPDLEICNALAGLPQIRQSATDKPLGAAACFNRLARETAADTIILLESGTIVSPGWLEKLLAALSADPSHGIASPSTNRAWNQLGAFPRGRGSELEIAHTAAEADRRFGWRWKSLAPLWDVGDFCLAVTRAAFQAVGEADETYGQGPCWEMDYAIRAVRAGFVAVWAQGSYVFRHPFTARRQYQETRLLDASRRRYQDKFCGLRLRGERTAYARHCLGEGCAHFAPTEAQLGSAATNAAPQTVPLVSCIMPTSGRPEWVSQAIRYFQRQDYPNLELVIVDAAADGSAATIPDDPRIRHHRIPPRRSIGAMRNVACELAHGDIIVQWDDDDWYAPGRVAAQVRPILEGRADLTGLTDTRFLELTTGRFWQCTPRLHRRLFVQDLHGGTLAFRRRLLSANCRYPDLSLAEDAWFLQAAVAAGARVERIPGADLFVYVRHSGNAWAFACGSYLDPSGWIEVPEPAALLHDRPFYAARSPAMSAAKPAIISPPAVRLRHHADHQMPAIPSRREPEFSGAGLFFQRTDYRG
jgi:glycosyltransferase involved in cell wall biosynthesis